MMSGVLVPLSAYLLVSHEGRSNHIVSVLVAATHTRTCCGWTLPTYLVIIDAHRVKVP